MYISADSYHHSTIIRTLRDVDVVELLSQFAYIMVDTDVACVYFCLYMLHTVLFIAVYCEKKTRKDRPQSRNSRHICLCLFLAHSSSSNSSSSPTHVHIHMASSSAIFVNNDGLVNSDTMSHTAP